MPIIHELENLEEVLDTLRTEATLLNDLDFLTDAGQEDIKQRVYETCHSDLISSVPSCTCGELKGAHRLKTAWTLAAICPKCHTPVKSSVDEDIKPVLWLRVPNGVHTFVNPHIWLMLCRRFTKKGVNAIRWLTDSGYRPTTKANDVIKELRETNIPRGFNYFTENIDAVLDQLQSLKTFKEDKAKDDPLKRVMDAPLRRLINEQRKSVFTSHLPIPNKSILLIEVTNVGSYADLNHLNVMDVVQILINCDNPLTSSGMKIREKENRVSRALTALADYFQKYYDSTISPKEGIVRKHFNGTRMHFSARGVITSITDPHDYDEIHIPWGMAVVKYRPYIMNKLLRAPYRMCYNNAVKFWFDHINHYDPTLDKILAELIKECPFNGIPEIIHRNPSLMQGSMLYMRITKVKKDPADKSISLPILVVGHPNADQLTFQELVYLKAA